MATVTTSDASGTQTLEVRKDKDKNYYAKSSAVEGIYKSTADLGDGLDKSVDDFRNKKLFDFGFTDPTKVEVGSTVYQKSGEKWMSGNKQMDSASVQSLIDKLRDLAATKFVDKAAGDPFLVLAVTSGDGKRVEKVTSRSKVATTSPRAKASQAFINWTPRPSTIFRKRLLPSNPTRRRKAPAKK